MKDSPRSPVQHVVHEDEVLLDQRTIEAVALDQRLAQGLIGGRIDHHVDRVADGIDAQEHDDRHGDHDHERLQNALDKKTDHAVPCMDSCCRGVRHCLPSGSLINQSAGGKSLSLRTSPAGNAGWRCQDQLFGLIS